MAIEEAKTSATTERKTHIFIFKKNTEKERKSVKRKKKNEKLSYEMKRKKEKINGKKAERSPVS